MKKTEFLSYNFEGKNILIIGKPSSGKTFVSALLKGRLPDHTLIHTDDYLSIDKELAIINILRLALKSKNYIIEGVMGYQILNNCIKYRGWTPEVIINVDISFPTLAKNYAQSGKSLNSIKRFCFRHKKLLDNYLKVMPSNVEFITLKNDKRIF